MQRQRRSTRDCNKPAGGARSLEVIDKISLVLVAVRQGHLTSGIVTARSVSSLHCISDCLVLLLCRMDLLEQIPTTPLPHCLGNGEKEREKLQKKTARTCPAPNPPLWVLVGMLQREVGEGVRLSFLFRGG